MLSVAVPPPYKLKRLFLFFSHVWRVRPLLAKVKTGQTPRMKYASAPALPVLTGKKEGDTIEAAHSELQVFKHLKRLCKLDRCHEEDGPLEP